jgi:hypothetical protein
MPIFCVKPWVKKQKTLDKMKSKFMKVETLQKIIHQKNWKKFGPIGKPLHNMHSTNLTLLVML